MEPSNISTQMRDAAGFASEVDAERALVETLQALGAALPRDLVTALSDALPYECTFPLVLGHGASGVRPHAAGWFGPETTERIQRTYGALCAMLDAELVHELADAIPGWVRGGQRATG